MIRLPSHRRKQWGQLGENLGGVEFPWSRQTTGRLMKARIARGVVDK